MTDVTMEVKGAAEASRFIKVFHGRLLPEIQRRTVNDLAYGAQKKQREHMRTAFNVRGESFLKHSTKIQFAKAADDPIQARFYTGDAPGRDTSDIFSKFEEGGVKVARGNHLSVPSGRIKRWKTGRVSPTQLPRELMRRHDLRQAGRRRAFKGKGIDVAASGHWFGTKGVYMVKTPQGTGGIFKRRPGDPHGPGEELWSFTKTARIQPSLRFIENTVEYVEGHHDEKFHRSFMYVMRTAR